jgi:NADPH:quinone reductase-like Zn-dependent oxidoreductase
VDRRHPRQLWATLLSAFVPQKLTSFVVKENASELLAINQLIADGKVRPVLGPTFPLAAGADAVAAFEAGRADGRITINP